MNFDNMVRVAHTKNLEVAQIRSTFSIGRTAARRVKAAVEGYRLAAADAATPLDILVIGDAHASPSDPDDYRFPLIGRAITAMRPDVVVCIGDWADLESLGAFDRGKKQFEGRRYKKDIAAANGALQAMESAITVDYDLRKVFCTGNHEARIDRVGELLPHLDGILSLDDLDIYRNWETYDFLDHVSIGGVLFSHYFVSGVMGRPITSVNKGRKLIMQTLQSTVSGHSHELKHDFVVRADGTRVHGLDVGCSFDSHHAWAGVANAKYWRGINMLRGVRNGEFDLESISFGELRRRFGG